MKSISAAVYLSLASLATCALATSGHESATKNHHKSPENHDANHDASKSSSVSCGSSVLATGTIIPTETGLPTNGPEDIPKYHPGEMSSSTSDYESVTLPHETHGHGIDPVNDCFDDEMNSAPTPILDELSADRSIATDLPIATPLPSDAAAFPDVTEFDSNILSGGLRNFRDGMVLLLLAIAIVV